MTKGTFPVDLSMDDLGVLRRALIRDMGGLPKEACEEALELRGRLEQALLNNLSMVTAIERVSFQCEQKIAQDRRRLRYRQRQYFEEIESTLAKAS